MKCLYLTSLCWAPVTFAGIKQEMLGGFAAGFPVGWHPYEQPEHKFMCIPAQPVPVMIHDSEMRHVHGLPHCCNTWYFV